MPAKSPRQTLAQRLERSRRHKQWLGKDASSVGGGSVGGGSVVSANTTSSEPAASEQASAGDSHSRTVASPEQDASPDKRESLGARRYKALALGKRRVGYSNPQNSWPTSPPSQPQSAQEDESPVAQPKPQPRRLQVQVPPPVDESMDSADPGDIPLQSPPRGQWRPPPKHQPESHCESVLYQSSSIDQEPGTFDEDDPVIVRPSRPSVSAAPPQQSYTPPRGNATGARRQPVIRDPPSWLNANKNVAKAQQESQPPSAVARKFNPKPQATPPPPRSEPGSATPDNHGSEDTHSVASFGATIEIAKVASVASLRASFNSRGTNQPLMPMHSNDPRVRHSLPPSSTPIKSPDYKNRLSHQPRESQGYSPAPPVRGPRMQSFPLDNAKETPTVNTRPPVVSPPRVSSPLKSNRFSYTPEPNAAAPTPEAKDDVLYDEPTTPRQAEPVKPEPPKRSVVSSWMNRQRQLVEAADSEVNDASHVPAEKPSQPVKTTKAPSVADTWNQRMRLLGKATEEQSAPATKPVIVEPVVVEATPTQEVAPPDVPEDAVVTEEPVSEEFPEEEYESQLPVTKSVDSTADEARSVVVQPEESALYDETRIKEQEQVYANWQERKNKKSFSKSPWQRDTADIQKRSERSLSMSHHDETEDNPSNVNSVTVSQASEAAPPAATLKPFILPQKSAPEKEEAAMSEPRPNVEALGPFVLPVTQPLQQKRSPPPPIQTNNVEGVQPARVSPRPPMSPQTGGLQSPWQKHAETSKSLSSHSSIKAHEYLTEEKKSANSPTPRGDDERALYEASLSVEEDELMKSEPTGHGSPLAKIAAASSLSTDYDEVLKYTSRQDATDDEADSYLANMYNDPSGSIPDDEFQHALAKPSTSHESAADDVEVRNVQERLAQMQLAIQHSDSTSVYLEDDTLYGIPHGGSAGASRGQPKSFESDAPSPVKSFDSHSGRSERQWQSQGGYPVPQSHGGTDFVDYMSSQDHRAFLTRDQTNSATFKSPGKVHFSGQETTSRGRGPNPGTSTNTPNTRYHGPPSAQKEYIRSPELLNFWKSGSASQEEFEEAEAFADTDQWLDKDPDIAGFGDDDSVNAGGVRESRNEKSSVAASQMNLNTPTSKTSTLRHKHSSRKKRNDDVFDPFADDDFGPNSEPADAFFSPTQDPFATEESFSPLDWGTPSKGIRNFAMAESPDLLGPFEI